MDPQQFAELVAKVGKEAAEKIKAEMANYEAKAKALIGETAISKEAFEEYKKLAETSLKEIEEISKKQGVKITELSAIVNSNEVGSKSIAEVLKEDEGELRKLHSNKSGVRYYIVNTNAKGEFVMKHFDPSQSPTERKAAGPHASIDGLGSGNTASILQSINAATLLRMGGDAAIVSQYRNTPWVFDLCNLQNAGYEMPFALWYEEQVKAGASTTVAEGGTKPATQYNYLLKSSEYVKEATMLGFTDEFNLDFPRLQSDILGKGRTDLINRINTQVLTNITTAATAYNTAASFGSVSNANDFDVLAAMAAQVDNATFGAMANSAVMSTFKKYKMGILKSTQGEYLDRPSVLDNLSFVGNPAMGADDVLVGDFKQYNIMLRGGLIVRVGYNGTDFAENRFSVVLEQYYFDYISTIRKAAIVKGPDFSTVKTALIPA